MISIETKYHGPSATRGARIIASTCNGHRVTISREYELDIDDDHKAAARRLAEKFGWMKPGVVLQGGHTKNGMVFVFIDTQNQVTI